MTFSEALECLKEGGRVTRKCWLEMVFLKLQRPDEKSKMTHPYIYCEMVISLFRFPWTPQPIDLLEDDWQVLPFEEKPIVDPALLQGAIELRREVFWKLAERLQGDIAAEIRVMLGEGPYDTKLFDDAQRARRIEAMQKCAAENTSDAARHEAWMKMHLDAGWTWGPEFDPTLKRHNNLLPWDELPASTRSKARIFNLVAKAAAELAAL